MTPADLMGFQTGFRERLAMCPDARDYLASRVPAAPDLIDRFALGCTGGTFPPASYFTQRITFPLWSGSDLVGFRGKAWQRWDTARPKGVPWPSGGMSSTADPFGLTPATRPTFEEYRFAVLVEGEIDALTLWGLGIPTVAACMAQITQTAAARLAQHIDCVLVWADRDTWQSRRAGQKGAVRSAERLRTLGVNVRYMTANHPSVKDANDLFTLYGADEVVRFVSHHVNAAADEGPDSVIAQVTRNLRP